MRLQLSSIFAAVKNAEKYGAAEVADLYEQRMHDLSYSGREPRGIIDTVLVIDGHPLRVLATHLGLTYTEQIDQIRRLADLLSDDLHPTMLLGDFNVWLIMRPFTELRNLGFRYTRIRTFPTWPFPVLALDRIFVRAPVVIKSWSRHHSPNSSIASDHFPVVADMEITNRAACASGQYLDDSHR